MGRSEPAQKYRERHHQKLSRGLDRALDGAGEAQSTTMSSTVASEYGDEAHIGMADSLSESGMTQTSVANSLFDLAMGEQRAFHAGVEPHGPRDAPAPGAFQGNVSPSQKVGDPRLGGR